MVIDGALASLRPPDREPPRLTSLTPEQEAAVAAFLQHVATSGEAAYDPDLARQVLEEWWGRTHTIGPRRERAADRLAPTTPPYSIAPS